jgi:hypothetical protein
MKIVNLIAAGTMLLSLSSCKKNPLKTDGTDVAGAYKAGYLYNTWMIDDDNKTNQSSTINSVTFKDKVNPTFTFNKDNTYIYVYGNSGTAVTEQGNWTFDPSAKVLTLKPSVSTNHNYTFQVLFLTDENINLSTTYSQTVTSTNSEGVSTPRTTTFDETLYMEDQD